MEKTGELNILENLKRKMGALGGSSCLMSLNMMSLSLTIDVCRKARYFETLLDQWQECLPLGDARDVNSSSWGGKIWDMMKQDGDYWCGEFETDEVDWKLAELIVNIQYACQRHYFGAMAEAYFDNKLKDASVNVQRRQKTIEGFNRLPEEFTIDDVMCCFSMPSINAARMRTHRLVKDGLAEKAGDYVENGTTKARYKKTGRVAL